MRVRGITIPDNKQAQYGLTVLFGIGLSTAKDILSQAKVEPTKKVKDLSGEEEQAVRQILDEMILEGDLKREVSMNIKRLRDIHSYRGTRHALRLPSRGQTTKNNSRTVRGNKRVTMGSGKVKVSKT